MEEEEPGLVERPLYVRFLAAGPGVSLTTTLVVFLALWVYGGDDPLFGTRMSERVVLVLIFGTFLYYFVCAAIKDPGYVGSGWQAPRAAVRHLPMCPHCFQLKPPRSSHCRTCGACIRRRDHHCPWINNCVGHNNEHVFYVFVLSAAAVSYLTTFMLGRLVVNLYVLPGLLEEGVGEDWGVADALDAFLSGPHDGRLAALLVAAFLALVTCVLTSHLFIVQVFMIVDNATSIEILLLKRLHAACERKGLPAPPHPYNLGTLANIRRLFLPGITDYIQALLVPLGHERRCHAYGTHWPVREGEFQYLLEVYRKNYDDVLRDPRYLDVYKEKEKERDSCVRVVREVGLTNQIIMVKKPDSTQTEGVRHRNGTSSSGNDGERPS